MQKIILTLKDDSKLNFLLELLKQLNFVEVEQSVNKGDEYDFFASAGLWKNREIDAQQLRKQAWDRES